MIPFIAPRLGLDLGTSKTSLVSGNKITYSEPTAMVVDTRSKRVLYTGRSASERAGKLGAGSEMIRPVARGVIADYAATRFMLRKVFSQAMKSPMALRPMVAAAVPIKISSVHERALCDAAREAGAGKIYLVPCNLASYVAITGNMNDPRGSLIVDIGAGVTDISVIASNEIIVGRTLEFGGDDLTAMVQRLIEVNLGTASSREEAAQAKIKVGLQPRKGEKIYIRRMDTEGGSGLQEIEIPHVDLASMLYKGLKPLADGLQAALEETPPELYEDIFFRGVILTGGGSLLKGLADYFQSRFQVKVNMSKEPELTAIRGVGRIVNDFSKFREFFNDRAAF